MVYVREREKESEGYTFRPATNLIALLLFLALYHPRAPGKSNYERGIDKCTPSTRLMAGAPKALMEF